MAGLDPGLRRDGHREQRVHPCGGFSEIANRHWHEKRLEAEWRQVMTKIEKQRGRARGRWSKPPLPFDPKRNANLLDFKKLPDAASSPAALPAGQAWPRQCNPEDASRPKDGVSVSKPESVAAPEPEKDEGKDPGRRCAPLVARCDRPSKSPELKLKIKRMLDSKHCRFLKECGQPGELIAYFEKMSAGQDGMPEQRYFDAIDRRMRRSNWDDMRWWRELRPRPRDLPSLSAMKAADPGSAEAMMLRHGWYRGKAAAAAA
jgi:hypothetical protein